MRFGKRINFRLNRKRALLAELLQTEDEQAQILPVSLSQQRLWLLAQIEPGTAAYNIWVGLRLRGALNLDPLEKSLHAIVDRHESLRTTFDIRGAEPVQIVARHPNFALAYTDLSSFSATQIESEAYNRAVIETGKPFDLKQGPLFRAVLLRLGPEHHILLCVMHHIISDGWSAGLLVRELIANYGEFSKRPDYRPGPLPLQYGDYAIWQRQLLTDDVLERQLAYWKSKLTGSPPLLNLASDRVRPPVWSPQGWSQAIPLTRSALEQLKTISRSHEATVFMVALAAFNLLLYRYTDQADIVIGVPVAGRNHIETEPLIGCFVNTVALRTDLSGNPRFGTLLAQVRNNTLEAFANADVPFERVVQELRPVRNPSYNPIFQVAFGTTRAAVRSHSFAGLAASPYIVNATTSTFDISASLIEGMDDQWWIQLEYNTNLFDHDKIASMLSQYSNLLLAAATDPDKRISDINLCTYPEAKSESARELDFDVHEERASTPPEF